MQFRRKSPAALNGTKEMSFFDTIAAAYEDLDLVSLIPFGEADTVRIPDACCTLIRNQAAVFIQDRPQRSRLPLLVGHEARSELVQRLGRAAGKKRHVGCRMESRCRYVQNHYYWNEQGGTFIQLAVSAR